MGTWQSRSTQICGCRFGASLTEALASRNRANRQFLAFLGPFCTQCWPTAAPARHGRFPTPKCCGNLAQGRGAASKNVGHFRCTNQSIADNFPLKLNGRHGGATKDTKCKGDILGRNLGAKSWGEILRPNTGAEYWGRILGPNTRNVRWIFVYSAWNARPWAEWAGIGNFHAANGHC